MGYLVFEKITQKLAAGQSVRLMMAGSFFRLAVAAYGVSVAYLVNSRVIGTMGGMLAGDYLKDVEFDGIILTNGATAQDVTFQIAGGGAGSDRVLGEVSVIDGGRARTIANLAFAGASACGPLAGSMAYVQLWNPPGSGKNLIVEEVFVWQAITNNINFRFNNVALTTLAGNPPSKKANGAASFAELRTQNSVSALTAGIAILALNLAAGGAFLYPLREPIVVIPGFGLVAGGNVAADIGAQFEYFEEQV